MFKKNIIFVMLILFLMTMNCSCKNNNKKYFNKELKIRFKLPPKTDNYNIYVKDHTEFLKSENLYEKYIKNFNNNDLDIVPFWPVEFIEEKKITNKKIIITGSKGLDVLDNQIGREITFIHNEKYITIYLNKTLNILEGKITREMENDYSELKENEYKDKKLIEFLNVILDSLEFL